MINVSGPSDEDADAGAYLTLQGGAFVAGWVMGEWLALVIVSTPVLCVFAWVRLSDGGCALPHRGHYPVLVSAGLHLGGQRDSDMSTWWEAADGWTPTRLSRWVSVSLVYVVSLLCVFIMVCWSHCLATCAYCISGFNLACCSRSTHLQHSTAIISSDFCVPDLCKYGCLIDSISCPWWIVRNEAHVNHCVCGALRTNTVTLSAFSSHQNTDKALTPGGYTQLPWSSLSRGLELMRILSFWNCCVGFMITAWQRPDTASVCIHKGS